MLAGTIVAGAVLLALAWRWRGSGHLALGRLLCAALIATPALWHNWPLGLAVALLSWRGASTDHDPSGRKIAQNTDSGLFFTGWAALEAAARSDWIAGALLAGAGLAKGALYRLLPESNPEARWVPAPLRGRFLWRELAFAACAGAAAGYALSSNV